MGHTLNLSIFKKNRDFSLLYGGQFISFIGTMITGVAAPYQIYAITGSTLSVGLLSLVQLVPVLFTALAGGVLADRCNRKFILLTSEILLMSGCATLAWNASLDKPSEVLIYSTVAFMMAVNGLHRPAFDSMTQQVVEPKDYKTVGALSSFKFSFSMIVGPAIAGLIIARHGLILTYLIDFLTFFISIINLLLMHKIPAPAVKHETSVFKSLKEGIQFAWARQELMGSYTVDFIAMIFAMPNALFPAIAQSFDGAKTLGFLYSAPAAGALLISFFSGWTSKIQADGQAIAISAIMWGFAMIGFGLSHNLWLALFFLALSGVFDTISGIFRSTLWNTVIPHEFRGRLAGIEMLSYLSGPKLGDTRAGILASGLGITTTVISGGIFCVLSVIACCWYMPKFWRYQNTHAQHNEIK